MNDTQSRTLAAACAFAVRTLRGAGLMFTIMVGPANTMAIAASGDPLVDFRVGEVRELKRSWQTPFVCEVRLKPTRCVLEAFLVCREFYRPDLCAHAGRYPEPRSLEEQLVYGFTGETDEPIDSSKSVYYRVVRVTSQFTGEQSPLSVLEVDVRSCSEMASEAVCQAWVEQYFVIWQPAPNGTFIAAWGWR